MPKTYIAEKTAYSKMVMEIRCPHVEEWNEILTSQNVHEPIKNKSVTLMYDRGEKRKVQDMETITGK